MSSVLFPEHLSSVTYGSTRSFHWQNWKSFLPLPPARSSLSPQGLAFYIYIFYAMLSLQQNICSKCLGLSSLPCSLFFPLFLFAWLYETELKETVWIPRFCLMLQKDWEPPKNSISSSASIPELNKNFTLMASKLIPWLNLLVASLCLLFSFDRSILCFRSSNTSLIYL